MTGEFIRYTAVWLDEPSRRKLLAQFPIPLDWDPRGTHMTVSLTSLDQSPVAALADERVVLHVIAMASDAKVAAVQVRTNVPCANAVPHITLGINIAYGGSSKHSNELNAWHPVQELELSGYICEVDRETRRPLQPPEPH